MRIATPLLALLLPTFAACAAEVGAEEDKLVDRDQPEDWFGNRWGEPNPTAEAHPADQARLGSIGRIFTDLPRETDTPGDCHGVFYGDRAVLAPRSCVAGAEAVFIAMPDARGRIDPHARRVPLTARRALRFHSDFAGRDAILGLNAPGDDLEELERVFLLEDAPIRGGVDLEGAEDGFMILTAPRDAEHLPQPAMHFPLGRSDAEAPFDAHVLGYGQCGWSADDRDVHLRIAWDHRLWADEAKTRPADFGDVTCGGWEDDGAPLLDGAFGLETAGGWTLWGLWSSELGAPAAIGPYRDALYRVEVDAMHEEDFGGRE